MHYLPEVKTDVVWAVVGSPWGWLAIWLAVMNLVTFFTFGVDKLKAKRKVKRASVRRVPEKTLFILAVLGGSIGALLGMKVWHHKTLHNTFRYGIPAILAVQAALMLGAYLYIHLR